MRPVRIFALAGALLLAGCHTELRANRVDPASFRIEMVCSGRNASDCPSVPSGAAECPAINPAQHKLDLGKPDAPVANDQKFYLANVSAIGHDGELYELYEGAANVYVMFNGSVSPPRNAMTNPAQELTFKGGKACLRFDMPPAFNQTSIWIEDSGKKRNEGSFAIGASAPIYRQPPTLADIQRTTDGDTTASPLMNKQVIIKGGTNGAPLVVTSVTQSSFTITDVGVPGEHHPWGSLLVYTFSKPTGVQLGATVKNVAGALTEFNGLTELNFPSWEFDDRTPDLSRLPAAREIKIGNNANNDLRNVLDKIEPYESALVEVKGWFICPIRSQRDRDTYTRYNQWKIAMPNSSAEVCDDRLQSMSIISKATAPGFDPEEFGGKKICSLKGILSHVIPAPRIHLWMITPRNADDIGVRVNPTEDCP